MTYSNTQIKRSNTNPVPAANDLISGQLGYSYVSDKLFIGNDSGTNNFLIGGRYYSNLVDQASNTGSNNIVKRDSSGQFSGTLFGNSNTATRLETGRYIALVGANVTANVIFDGSQNITLNVSALKGDTGNTGPQGPSGANGVNGSNGTNGINGANGSNGYILSPSITDIAGANDVGISNVTTSESFFISGDANTVWPIITRGQGNPQIEVNLDGVWASFGIVRNGDNAKIRVTSSSLVSTSVRANVYAQGVCKTFTVTTAFSSDVNVTSFITATGISNTTIQSAINDLVVSLKSNGLWYKLQAIYPFVGGSESTHKYNLKDPRDLDAAFRLSFTGGWTHSNTGALPNGNTANADTHFSPNTHFISTANGSMGFWSRSNTFGTTSYDMGSTTSSDTQAVITIARYTSPTTSSFFGYGTSAYTTKASQSNGIGFFVTNRKGGSNTDGYVNGNLFASAADSVSLSNFSIYIGAANKGNAATYFANKEHAFTFIGQGLSAQENLDLYNTVRTFQSILGR